MRLRPGGTPEICFKRPYRDANPVLTHLPSIKMLGYYHASLRDALPAGGRRYLGDFAASWLHLLCVRCALCGS